MAMTLELFSAEWARAWGELLRQDADYRLAARSWQWPVVVILRSDTTGGFAEERAVFLDLWEGDCREARLATARDRENSPFLIAADFAVLRQILDGRVDPIAALMRGKLQLLRGSLVKLMPYTQAAKRLVQVAAAIPTRFPEPASREPSP
jgi:putative sterol carrier protein